MAARSKNQNRWLPPLTFLISLIVLYFATMPLLDDPDVPWHIAAGKLMLATHELPASDPWSFATHGTPWYNLSWWWDIKLAVIESIAGLLGVFVFAMACSAALLAFLAWALLRRGIALQAVMLTLFIAAFCMLEFATARPQLAGYGLVLLFAVLLHESRRNDRVLFFLPLLMILWVNMHGSFIAAFTVLGAYIIDGYTAKNKRWRRKLIAVTLACAVCTLANPYGMHIYKGIMTTMDSVARDLIAEWQPLYIGKSIGLSVWLLAFALGSNIKNARATLADKILAFFWLICTLTAARNGAIFMFLSAPYVAACIDEQSRNIREPLSIPAWLEQKSALFLWMKSIILAVFFIAVVSAFPHDNRIESAQHSARDAIEYAFKHYPNHHFLTDYNLGGQVIYDTDGKLPMFMDSRAGTAYSEQSIADYADFLTLHPGWEDKINAYGVNAILLGNNQDFARAYAQGFYQDEWKLVFAGKAASVYISAP